MDAHVQDDKTIIQLGNALKISSITEQKSIYLQAITTSSIIDLHAGSLTSLDTASLQLLLSLILTANKKNISVNWISASKEIQHASKLLGIHKHLNLHLLN